MDDRPFYSVLSHLVDFYDITMDDTLFENIAMHAWDHIGNKNYRLYRHHTHVKNKVAYLPCNADIIEAVTTGGPKRSLNERYGEDVGIEGEISIWNHSNQNPNEAYVADMHINTEPIFERGKFMDYVRVDNTLHFEHSGFGINILYKGVIVDDQGLPLLNFKEVDAIAKYCAFIQMQKKAFTTKDQATFQMSQLLKQQWQFAVDDARTPIILNQNDMDNILDVQTSWDRKRFGKSFKPIR